jgi:hypothetical protein
MSRPTFYQKRSEDVWIMDVAASRLETVTQAIYKQGGRRLSNRIRDDPEMQTLKFWNFAINSLCTSIDVEADAKLPFSENK